MDGGRAGTRPPDDCLALENKRLAAAAGGLRELWAGGRAGVAERSPKIMLDMGYRRDHYANSI
jgi:hypothetical protein